MRIARRKKLNYTEAEIREKLAELDRKNLAYMSDMAAQGCAEPPPGMSKFAISSFAIDDPEAHAKHSTEEH